VNGSAVRVILIDDHAVLRDGLKALLALEPDIAVAGEAGTAREGMTLAERLEPDVVVVDLGLPDGSGVDVARAVRERLPDTRVLVLTVHDEDEFILALMEAGASGYVLKNVAGSDLVEAIRTVSQGKPWLQPEIARRVIELSSGARARAPATGLDSLIEPLTAREIEVLRLLAGAASNREIGDRLVISTRTVETHLANIYGKLGVRGRTEAMLWAIRERVVGVEQ
jgi:DNA-binding NarL/FixJ family response regulator